MTALILITLCFGFVLGYISRRFLTKAKIIGILRVDTSDPDDGPYLFLEIEQYPTNFKHGQHVMLEVDTRNYISHE